MSLPKTISQDGPTTVDLLHDLTGIERLGFRHVTPIPAESTTEHFAKSISQSLISSNHGESFFERCRWNAGWPRPFSDRMRHGLPWRIFPGESG